MKSTTLAFGAFGLALFMGACGGDDSNGGGGGTSDGGVAANDGGGSRSDAGGGGEGGARTDGGGTTTDGGGGPSGQSPVIAGCEVFPADNVWNTRIDDTNKFKVHPQWGAYQPNMAPSRALHADWGDWSTNKYGIPWQTVSGTQAKLPIAFTYASESDPGPYPFPLDVHIEPGDQHAIVLDTATCTIYESYNTTVSGGGFHADSGAKFDLHSNALRTDGFTSADAAGLPILPGLVRYAEVKAGEIRHAMRFTMNRSQNAYIHPAVHAAGSVNAALPPMGLRMRLKASFDLSRFSGEALVVLRAMKKYGLILADNGSDWYVSGDSDDAWTPVIDNINQAFNALHGSDFEAIDTGPLSTAGL